MAATKKSAEIQKEKQALKELLNKEISEANNAANTVPSSVRAGGAINAMEWKMAAEKAIRLKFNENRSLTVNRIKELIQQAAAVRRELEFHKSR